jgi:predicted esterase
MGTDGRCPDSSINFVGATVPPDADLAAGPATFRAARLTLVAGSGDQYISEKGLSTERARLSEAGVNFDVVTYAGGHSVKRSVLLDVARGSP